jgi:glycosyltransferase involved in cell wall biosynthesis
MNGKTAAEDRNGLQSLYIALRYTDANFTVTIKAQNDVQRHKDPRLVYDFTAPERQADLYDGFDALILPRRYAGQSLPMTEALYCGLPVVMTDIDPNNKVLPPEWLVPARKAGTLMTRIPLDVYSASQKALAEKLATLDTSKRAKMKARNIGMKYDSEHLRAKYERLKRWSR